MIWWEILLIIPILLTCITLLIFIIKDLKNEYKVFKILNSIAKDLEKNKNKDNEYN